ncbi:hypothetical protein L6R46_08205 [Myxococcota bacterium]|nr:hypothetical protein [Myxococcota bacterium]
MFASSLWIVLNAAFAQDPGPLVGDLLGPMPPATTLRDVDVHPEYIRLSFTTDRDFIVELTPRRDGASPVCSGGGADLYVRLDLNTDQESFDWEPLPPIVDQLCARMVDHPPRFPVSEKVQAPTAPPQGLERPKLPFRPIHLVVVAWAVAALAALPRAPWAWGLGLVGLLIRLGLSPRWILVGGDAAYERLLDAKGRGETNPYYGSGWAGVMGLVHTLLGEPKTTDWVHLTNLGFSALTVVALVGLISALGGSPLAAGLAGLALAAAPLPVRLAATETDFVLVGLVQVLALYGAARGDRRGALLAALSVGLSVHLRPLGGAFALLPLGMLAWRRSAWAVALGLGLCAWRAAELLPLVREGSGVGVIPFGRLLDPDFWVKRLNPLGREPALHLSPLWSPLAFPLLAIAAVQLSKPETRRAWLWPLSLGIVLSELPYLAKTSPFGDPLRFLLPATALWAGLAGFGAALAFERGGTRPRALLVVAALSFLPPWLRGQPRWAWQVEHLALVEATRLAPAGEEVLFDPAFDENGKIRLWLNTRGEARWRPWAVGETPAEGTLVYLGSADHHRRLEGGGAGPSLAQGCALTPLTTRALPPETDGWIQLGDAPIPVGLYRVGACGEGSGSPNP